MLVALWLMLFRQRKVRAKQQAKQVGNQTIMGTNREVKHTAKARIYARQANKKIKQSNQASK